MAASLKETTKVSNVKSVQHVQAEESANELDLTELLYHVWDHKWLVVILAALGAIVMAVYSQFFAVKMYSAQSVLYIGNNDGSIVSLSDLQIGSSLTKDYISVFNMWEVHAKVQQKMKVLSPNKNYSEGALRSTFSISNPSNTRLLYIKITAPDPVEAAKIANAYAEAGKEIISEKMNVGTDLTILSEAREGVRSLVSPNKTKNIILGFAVGVLLSLVIITIQFLSDTKIKTENDIRKYVNLPVLAVVPVMRKEGEKRGKSVHKHREKEE